MKKKKFYSLIINITLFLTAYAVFIPQMAEAYLDPGTGSYIIQVVVAALLGIAFVLKAYLKKVVGLVVNALSRRKEKDGSLAENKDYESDEQAE